MFDLTIFLKLFIVILIVLQTTNCSQTIQDKVLKAFRQGGYVTDSTKTIGRTFRIFDDDGNRSLTYSELRNGLNDYGVFLSEDEETEYFNFMDKDGNGKVDFDEFLQTLKPPMSKARVDLVNKVFDYLSQLSGVADDVIGFEDLKDEFDYSYNPKYKSGEWTEQQVLEAYLNLFEKDAATRDGKVTREEFIEYYDRISKTIDNDDYFGLMVEHAWPDAFKDPE